MTYVQYYQWGKVSPTLSGLVEPCGDRCVFILDGRNSLETLHKDAREANGNRRPKYLAYRIMKGRSFMDSQPLTKMVQL